MPQHGREDSGAVAEGAICKPCFTTAARTYGLCSFCGTKRLVPGRTPTGELLCRDCAGITTNLDCDHCGREAERLRGGHCARCVVTSDLEQLLSPHHPPDMRLKRLIVELAAVPRPETATSSASSSRSLPDVDTPACLVALQHFLITPISSNVRRDALRPNSSRLSRKAEERHHRSLNLDDLLRC